MTKKINSFKGKYRFLSNFYPVEIKLNEITFPSVEHAYQALKSIDKSDWRKIAALSTAKEAKKAGKTLNVRHDWKIVKVPIMYKLLKRKFNNPELGQLLLDTEDAILEEGNWWGDTFWGVCNGEGKNYLGKLLMRVRHDLKNRKII